jgi:hypothetical protein
MRYCTLNMVHIFIKRLRVAYQEAEIMSAGLRGTEQQVAGLLDQQVTDLMAPYSVINMPAYPPLLRWQYTVPECLRSVKEQARRMAMELAEQAQFAGRGLSPDMPSSCNNRRARSPRIARGLHSLAPRLAPPNPAAWRSTGLHIYSYAARRVLSGPGRHGRQGMPRGRRAAPHRF